VVQIEVTPAKTVGSVVTCHGGAEDVAFGVEDNEPELSQKGRSDHLVVSVASHDGGEAIGIVLHNQSQFLSRWS